MISVGDLSMFSSAIKPERRISVRLGEQHFGRNIYCDIATGLALNLKASLPNCLDTSRSNFRLCVGEHPFDIQLGLLPPRPLV